MPRTSKQQFSTKQLRQVAVMLQAGALEKIRRIKVGDEHTRLYDLPDSWFESGGEIHDLATAAGHAGGRAWANEHRAWDMTLAEAREALAVTNRGGATVGQLTRLTDKESN